MKKIVFCLALFLGFSFSNAYSYWIWTPKTGKWVNPKKVTRASPKEQFEFAKGLYDIKNYDEAKREFKKLLSAYPKSVEAADAQYHLGLIEETQGNLFEAYLAYQKVIEKYPFFERVTEINEREFKIAEAFMGGEKRKSLGITLPVENPSIEIFSKVLENSAYGPLAAKAQYKLGLVFKGLMRYYEAEEAFQKIVSNYPESEWVSAAQYQIAACRAAVSKGPDYDQGATSEAMRKFEDFLKEHPDAALSNEAQKNIEELREKEAQSNYNVGRFYEKQKAYDAAKIYYGSVVEVYPKSPWALKSFERLRILEKKK